MITAGGVGTMAGAVVVGAVDVGGVVEPDGEVVVTAEGDASSPELHATASVPAAPARNTRRETGGTMAGP